MTVTNDGTSSEGIEKKGGNIRCRVEALEIVIGNLNSAVRELENKADLLVGILPSSECSSEEAIPLVSVLSQINRCIEGIKSLTSRIEAAAERL